MDSKDFGKRGPPTKIDTGAMTARRSSDLGLRRGSKESLKMIKGRDRRLSAETLILAEGKDRDKVIDSSKIGCARRRSTLRRGSTLPSSLISTLTLCSIGGSLPHGSGNKCEESNVEITDGQFDRLMQQLTLDSRKKPDSSTITQTVLELQLAAARYYLPVKKIVQLLLSQFSQETSSMQARVVISIFSRILDLHNFDQIMRILPGKAQNEIILRLGWLNIFNPLKPAFNYTVSLKHWDGRILMSMLLTIGKAESSEEEDGIHQMKDDPKSNVSLFRLVNDIDVLEERGVWRDDTVLFSYGEVAERSLNVDWETRKVMLDMCLIGTGIYEDDADEDEYRRKGKLDGGNIYDIITWYDILRSTGSFSKGPLDLQYEMYCKYGTHKQRNP